MYLVCACLFLKHTCGEGEWSQVGGWKSRRRLVHFIISKQTKYTSYTKTSVSVCVRLFVQRGCRLSTKIRILKLWTQEKKTKKKETTTKTIKKKKRTQDKTKTIWSIFLLLFLIWSYNSFFIIFFIISKTSSLNFVFFLHKYTQSNKRKQLE